MNDKLINRIGSTHTSTPPMQKRTTKSSTNQADISLYSMTKKHEAITTNKTADVVLMSTIPAPKGAFAVGISSAASYKTKIHCNQYVITSSQQNATMQKEIKYKYKSGPI